MDTLEPDGECMETMCPCLVQLSKMTLNNTHIVFIRRFYHDFRSDPEKVQRADLRLSLRVVTLPMTKLHKLANVLSVCIKQYFLKALVIEVIDTTG